MTREAIDWSVIEEINRKDIKGFGQLLHHFDITEVMNPKKFFSLNGFKPYIGSIFLLASGSFDFDDPKYGNVDIYNGSVSDISTNPDLMRIAGDFYSQKKWGYKASDYY